MGARQYTNREWKLLSYWLATYHPHADIQMQVRLGPTLPLVGIQNMTAAQAALSRVRNRWADALFIEGGIPTIVEAKLEPDPGIFSQLLHYARKFRADPNFTQFANSPLKLAALVYHDDPSVAMEAPWYGVSWNVFQPQFEGWPPPSVKGTPLADSPDLLPQDWPARLYALTHQPWGSGG
ncbi:MAG TPA: hypothetical protein VGI65_00745 [Steroidobacteraceae bacterium]|jgi:hypothetical protein